MKKPIEYLKCVCCSTTFKGRHWVFCNRGTGICDDCITDLRDSGMPEVNIRFQFGIEGYNHHLKEKYEINK